MTFNDNDIPVSAQSYHKSQFQQNNNPPPTPPIHNNNIPTNSSSPYPLHNDNRDSFNKNGKSNNDIELQQRQSMPYHSSPQQQQAYYNYGNNNNNNMYPPPPQQQPYYNHYPPYQQQQQQPLLIVDDKYAGHPMKRALLGPIRRPIFSHLSALAMLAILIYELVRNYQLTGSVIQTSPYINPMIGPTAGTLINLGAKFAPCMRLIQRLGPSDLISCFDPSKTCTVAELCGLPPNTIVPDQAYRFVLPIFEHAGIVHFIINMLTHLRLGVDLERSLGTPRYVLLYMASGIWGFILSAMLASTKSASCGCSGALFGIIGYMFIDLAVNWKVMYHPGAQLGSLLFSVIISLVLGLLPGLDNFAHIGGFVTGLVVGVLIADVRPNATTIVKWITWISRLIAAALLVVMFVVGIKQFYSIPDPSQICPNCKYLSCLPVSGWGCDS
ncbi:unnamed protein product [Cunninghamella blakesleeana]